MGGIVFFKSGGIDQPSPGSIFIVSGTRERRVSE
jgi:hypothetical protein